MGKKVYQATSLTGGATGALDAINGSLLADGDLAIVTYGGRAYLYELDHDNSSAEASPWIICPDKNYGTKRWVLKTFDYHNTTLARAYLGTNMTTMTHNTEEKILLDTESYDVGGNFASYKYTVPTGGAGYHHIVFSAYFSPGAETPTAALSRVKKNNTTNILLGNYGPAASGHVISNGAGTIYLAEADYIELWGLAYTVAGSGDCTVVAGENYTFLEVFLVSK